MITYVFSSVKHGKEAFSVCKFFGKNEILHLKLRKSCCILYVNHNKEDFLYG